jgi:vesicle-fusing ATPase
MEPGSTYPNLKIVSTPNAKYAWANRVHVSKNTFMMLARAAQQLEITFNRNDPAINITISGTKFVFQAAPIDGVADNELAMNQLQRKCTEFALNRSISIAPFVIDSEVALSSVTVSVDLVTKKAGTPKQEFNVEELSASFKSQLGGQIFALGQNLAFDFNGTKLDIIVEGFEHADVGIAGGKPASQKTHGQVLQITEMHFKKQGGSQTPMVFTGANNSASARMDIYRSDFDMGKIGIGGLDEEFKVMFRRAFGSRMFPGLVKQLGINHIRGNHEFSVDASCVFIHGYLLRLQVFCCSVLPVAARP